MREKSQAYKNTPFLPEGSPELGGLGCGARNTARSEVIDLHEQGTPNFDGLRSHVANFSGRGDSHFRAALVCVVLFCFASQGCAGLRILVFCNSELYEQSQKVKVVARSITSLY